MVWWHNRTLTYSIKQNPANVFVARFNPITNLRIGPALWIVWFNMSRVEDARKKGEKTSIINIDGNHLAFWEHFGLQIRDAHAGWLSSRVSPRCCFFFATFFLGRGSLFFLFFFLNSIFSIFFSLRFEKLVYLNLGSVDGDTAHVYRRVRCCTRTLSATGILCTRIMAAKKKW